LFEPLFLQRLVVSEILSFVLSKEFYLAPSPFSSFVPFRTLLRFRDII
jgi:hypothetical protein